MYGVPKKKGSFQIAPDLMSNHPREKRRQCRIVIGRNGRKPIWLTVPIVLHRELPSNVDIRHVEVVRSLLAGKARWKVCITLRILKKPTTTNTLSCGVNFGWRKLADGSIRVATSVDDAGHIETLELAKGDMDEFQKLDGLQAVMKRAANKIQEKLTNGLPSMNPPQLTAEEIKPLIKRWETPC